MIRVNVTCGVCLGAPVGLPRMCAKTKPYSLLSEQTTGLDTQVPIGNGWDLCTWGCGERMSCKGVRVGMPACCIGCECKAVAVSVGVRVKLTGRADWGTAAVLAGGCLGSEDGGTCCCIAGVTGGEAGGAAGGAGAGGGTTGWGCG